MEVICVQASEVLDFLDPRIKRLLIKLFNTRSDIQEIRLRANKPLEVVLDNQNYFVASDCDLTVRENEAVIVTTDLIDSCVAIMSNYSIYSIEDELKNGFITLRGGHRVGVAGKVVLENGNIKTIKNISNLNVRIAKEIKGAADKIIPYVIDRNIIRHTLIVSPPQCGKTTIVRDLARQLSDGIERLKFKGIKVGIVDERSEIASCYKGIPQNDIGKRTDVLDACPKSMGIIMLIRSMSPSVIITDEIGTYEDIHAIEQALSAGIKVVTTVHGQDVDDLKNKPVFSEVLSKGIFERIVILSNKSGVGTIEDILDGKSLKSYIHKA